MALQAAICWVSAQSTSVYCKITSRMGALPLATCSKRAARTVENFPPICAVARVNDRRLPSPLCRPTAPFAPNCGCFYEIAIRADDHQRNEAG